MRIRRLEPYFRKGRYYFPAVVWNPNIPGAVGNLAYWSIADKTDEAHREGQIVYRPYKGPSQNQMAAEKTGQGFRIATPIKQIDEDRNVYDLTRAMFEEMLFFPFSPKDSITKAAASCAAIGRIRRSSARLAARDARDDRKTAHQSGASASRFPA
jgi:hypothetical protein